MRTTDLEIKFTWCFCAILKNLLQQAIHVDWKTIHKTRSVCVRNTRWLIMMWHTFEIQRSSRIHQIKSLFINKQIWLYSWRHWLTMNNISQHASDLYLISPSLSPDLCRFSALLHTGKWHLVMLISFSISGLLGRLSPCVSLWSIKLLWDSFSDWTPDAWLRGSFYIFLQ